MTFQIPLNPGVCWRILSGAIHLQPLVHPQNSLYLCFEVQEIDKWGGPGTSAGLESSSVEDRGQAGGPNNKYVQN